jgi:hypothetical protein
MWLVSLISAWFGRATSRMYDHNLRHLCDFYCTTDEICNTAYKHFHKTEKACFCDIMVTKEGQAGCEGKQSVYSFGECEKKKITLCRRRMVERKFLCLVLSAGKTHVRSPYHNLKVQLFRIIARRFPKSDD